MLFKTSRVSFNSITLPINYVTCLPLLFVRWSDSAKRNCLCKRDKREVSPFMANARWKQQEFNCIDTENKHKPWIIVKTVQRTWVDQSLKFLESLSVYFKFDANLGEHWTDQSWRQRPRLFRSAARKEILSSVGSKSEIFDARGR